MRVSVQMRVPDPAPGERWARSVYLDPTPRDFLVPFEEMRPAGSTTSATPRPEQVRTLLFVVDTTHATPGSRWEFRLSNVGVVAGRYPSTRLR